MKKLNLCFGILMGILMCTSCSDSDDSDSELEAPSIVGVWKQINEIDYCSTGSQEILNSDACEQTGRLTFVENGDYSATSYQLDGSNCVLYTTETGTWAINNGVLNIINVGGTFQFTTLEVTDTSLKIGADQEDQGEPCNDGFLTRYTLQYTRVQ